jgi:hypothetical protein
MFLFLNILFTYSHGIEVNFLLFFQQCLFGLFFNHSFLFSDINFPNYFKYNEKQYNQIETQLSLYHVQNFCIGKIETTQPESDISSFYTLLTPLSVDNISSIPIHLSGLYKEHIIKTIESTIVEEISSFSIRD